MTDPLSVAASVARLISLEIQVTQSLVDFYNAYENRDSQLVHMIERLDSLLDIFQCLKKTLSDRHFQADERSLVESIETSIKSYEGLIQELQDECQKLSSSRLTASFWPLHLGTRLSDCGTLKQRSQHSKSNISTVETSPSVRMGHSSKWTGDF